MVQAMVQATTPCQPGLWAAAVQKARRLEALDAVLLGCGPQADLAALQPVQEGPRQKALQQLRQRALQQLRLKVG